MSNEADTCRTYILPKLQAAGWEDDYIIEQHVLTPSCNILVRNKHMRRLQAKLQAKLDTLLPSMPVLSEVEGLGRAFKGKLLL